MSIISKLFIILAGVFHVLFFVLESILFMNEKVYKVFGATSTEEALVLQNFAFNQGFYNLFLAIGAIGGTLFANKLKQNVGNSVAVFSCACMIGAGLVLFFSTGKVLGTAIQAGIPAIGLIAFYMQSAKPQ